MMTCCKEKAVLVAVYKEKPRKGRLTTGNKHNIKHHHHHHHHYLHAHQSNNNKGNRKAELLSYSQHLRQSSKLKASTPPHHPKSLVTSSHKDQEIRIQVHDDPKNQKLKKQSSRVDMNNIFKCFAVSHAKRKVKRKKKKSSESSSKKASVMMKKFNARTQKGAREFFSKLIAFIQKHR